MLKKLISILLSLTILASIFIFSASAYQISGFALNAKSAILVSLDSGEVLFAKAQNEKMYPASITKLLVAILLLEKAENLDTTMITTNRSALNAISGTGASVIGLKEGEELTARQALYCLLVSSGGDVAYTIAEYCAGSVDAFIDMMNQKAVQLGMASSHFGNPVGLHDDQTYTTASDIVILAKQALTYKEIIEVTSVPRYTVAPTNKSPSRILSTTNFLIDPNTNYYYKYAKGLKTGFTDEAGRCVVSTASYNGYNYLCVVLGCTTKGGRNDFIDSKNLYRWAFNNFEYKSILDTTKPVAEIPVELSMSTDHLQLYPESSIKSILPTLADESTIYIEPHLISETVDAPIKAGDVLGTADVIYASQVIGTVNLIAKENIRANIFLRIGRGIKKFFSSTAFKIILSLIIAAVVIYILIVIKLNASTKKRRKVKFVPYDKHGKNR